MIQVTGTEGLYGADFTDEDIEDRILGAGADSYEWWVELGRGKDGGYTAIIMDESEDTEESDHERTFTGADFLDLCRRVLSGELASQFPGQVIRDLANDDLDSDSTDSLLQYLVFGEIVYI